MYVLQPVKTSKNRGYFTCEYLMKMIVTANRINKEPKYNSFLPKRYLERIEPATPAMTAIMSIELGILLSFFSCFLTNKPNPKNGIPMKAKFRTSKLGSVMWKTESPSPNNMCNANNKK